MKINIEIGTLNINALEFVPALNKAINEAKVDNDNGNSSLAMNYEGNANNGDGSNDEEMYEEGDVEDNDDLGDSDEDGDDDDEDDDDNEERSGVRINGRVTYDGKCPSCKGWGPKWVMCTCGWGGCYANPLEVDRYHEFDLLKFIHLGHAPVGNRMLEDAKRRIWQVEASMSENDLVTYRHVDSVYRAQGEKL